MTEQRLAMRAFVRKRSEARQENIQKLIIRKLYRTYIHKKVSREYAVLKLASYLKDNFRVVRTIKKWDKDLK